jgi:hypothetical protein
VVAPFGNYRRHQLARSQTWSGRCTQGERLEGKQKPLLFQSAFALTRRTACSIHVEVALEDAFLECIGLRPVNLWLHGLYLDGRLWHVGDGFGAIVLEGGIARRRASTEREGRPCSSSLREGALGSGPELLGPIETLLIIAGATAWAVGPHGRSAEAHAPRKGGGGRRSRTASIIVVFDGALINRIRVVGVGRHAAAADAEAGLVLSGGGSGETEGSNREAPTLRIIHYGRLSLALARERLPIGAGGATLEQVGEGGLGDGAPAVSRIGIAVGRHSDKCDGSVEL